MNKYDYKLTSHRNVEEIRLRHLEQYIQKSVIPVSTIVKGEMKENGKVAAKWRGQLYEAEIIKLGMYVANRFSF